MPGLISELQRRNVIRTGVFYAAAAWLLVQVATQVFPFFHIAEWVVRWIVIGAIVGFPFAIVSSWFYRITPHGVLPESESETYLAVTPLVAGMTAVESPSLANSEPSVAILPFADFSAAKDQDYFCDGLSEDLITALSQFAGLRVISRDSSFQFRGSNESSASVGQKLGVFHLLEGSVRRDGEAIRVSARLVNAANNSTLWSQHYDRPYRELFALQDDITHAVASVLQAKLLHTTATTIQDMRPPSGSLDAYSAWLRGNFYSARAMEDDLRRAIGDYDQAITLDPRYAQAFADRSLAWTDLASVYLSGQPAIAAYESGRENALHSLRLAPDLPDGHLTMGRVLEYLDFDLAGAEVAYRKAATLAPDAARPKLNLGRVLSQLGRLQEGVGHLRQALQVDPLHSRTYRELADIELATGQLDAAEQAIRMAIALRPDTATNFRTLVYISICRGDMEAALRDAEQEPAVGYRVVEVMMALQIGDDRSKADAALAHLIAEYGDYVAFQIASGYALRKDPDNAFLWLDRALAVRDPGVCKVLLDPFLRAYKDDPRFSVFCRKVGVPTPGDMHS